LKEACLAAHFKAIHFWKIIIKKKKKFKILKMKDKI
jgi:hypothetical protein